MDKIIGLFYTVLGSKTEQLEKETQEMLAVQLKYEACCKAVKQLEKELKEYETILVAFCDVESEYALIIKKKEYAILGVNDGSSQRLSALMEQSTDLELQKKELQEAVDAGETVLTELKNVMRLLESAKGWGTWDMLGGGVIATSVKHSRIDDAKMHAQKAMHGLEHFKRELSDVNKTINLDINIGAFNTFADYFFAGLIADWVVQSKLEKSSVAVRSVSDTVGKVMCTLNEQRADVSFRKNTVNRHICYS